ncbi:hypothetical protein FOBRF1_013349 [Fusarium oxysporum]
MPQLRHLTASLMIGSFTLMGATVQANDRNPLTEDFNNFAIETLDDWKVPGLSIAVIDGDQVFAEGYGFATLPDEPATQETLWYGASTTKAQTAATLAYLIDSGEYPALANGWSTTISSIINDDFVLQDAWATDHITLDDAISHRRGMAAHHKAYAAIVKGKEAKPKDIVRNLRNLPLITEPRVKYSYTDLMYTTISHVIETITGKWLGDVMKELIWAPLHMNSTFFDLQDANRAPHHLASGYYWDSKEGRYGKVPSMNVTQLSGAGAVFSNVLDYAKWRRGARFWSPGLLAADIRYGVVAFANTAVTSNAVEEILAWKLIQDRLEIPENERFDVNSKYHKIMEELSPTADESVDILYPERPDPPSPPTVNITELQGIYYDPGYGQIRLREEPHPDRPDEKILVADRQDMTWKYQMRLHHVSGDYWIIYLPFLENPGYIIEFVAGEFKIGNNGKAVGLLVDWVSRPDDVFEGKVLFKKVD